MKPDNALRTTFPAPFSAVEGDLLAQLLRHFHASQEAGRLCTPAREY